jgi:hypothetical protein
VISSSSKLLYNDQLPAFVRVHKQADGTYHVFTDFTLYTEKKVEIPTLIQRKFGLEFDSIMDMQEAFPEAESSKKVRAYAWFQDLYETDESVQGSLVSVYSTVGPWRPVAMFRREDIPMPPELEARMASGQGEKGILTLDETLYEMIQQDDDLGVILHPDSIALLAYTEGRPIHTTVIEQYSFGSREIATARSPYWTAMGELANLLRNQHNALLSDGTVWLEEITPASLDALHDAMMGQVAMKESVRKTKHRFVVAS